MAGRVPINRDPTKHIDNGEFEMAERYDSLNLNTRLSGFALEAMRAGGAFISDRLMPVVQVLTTAFKYYKFNNLEMITDDLDTIRAPKGYSNEISRSYTSATGTCQQHGLRELVADEEMRNADGAVIDPKRDSALVIQRKLRLGIERRIIAKVMAAGTMTENGAASTHWNNTSGVDIEGDVDAAKLNVRKKAGVEPNTIVIPPHIAVAAKKDSAIRDLVKYTQSNLLVNGDLPPKLFGLEVLIPTAVFNEADPGVATASKDFAWDDNSVLVAYVEREMPGMKSLSLGYQFRRQIEGSLDIAMYDYREDGRHGDVVEGLIEQLEDVVSVECGFLITGAYV